jgi:hypothetical protein
MKRYRFHSPAPFRISPMPLLMVLLMMILAATGTALAQNSDSDNEPDCPADIRWLNTGADPTYSRSGQLPASLSVLVHVSISRNCSHEITLTATYLTETLEYICNGTIRRALQISSEVQNFNIEIRPFNQVDFLRWRNEPGVTGIRQGKRLPCAGLDGTADVNDTERQKAAWVRLSVAVLSRGGLDVEEVTLRINP